jgi:putative OPT family oligopeptide transporter
MKPGDGGGRRGLGRQAYEPLPEGGSYEPYVAARESPLELTARAVIPGVAFGVLFGAANAYLGLQAGLTVSTSIPIAVMTIAAFRLLRRAGVRGTILEANMAQTIGSASSSVASGVIFTLPALFMWHLDPRLLQMTLLALCGGVIGVVFMVPLRRFLIDREHGRLPYPEGTACAEVLVASEEGGSQARNVFIGLGAGAALKLLFGWLKALPEAVIFPVPGLLKAELGLKLSPALFGVGYILGPRVGTVMVGGGLVSSLVVIPAIAWWGAERTAPFFPETERLIAEMGPGALWDRYVRYIGAGAVATAGLITLIRSVPTMLESFRIALGQMRSGARAGAGGAIPRTDRDLSLGAMGVLLVIVVAAMAAIPQTFAHVESLGLRAAAAVLVVIFSFFFVTVSSRIVGLVGVTSNPTSGMTIASLIGTATVFLLMGWTGDAGRAAALSVGCVIAIAASIAGDTSQDLKTGYLLGATPRRQQIGELLGVLTSAAFVCLAVQQLGRAYGFGSADLAAPQATLMKLVIDGVLQAQLPWTLVAIGVALAVAAELARIPSLPFAVGVYLPVTTMVPVFLGGALRWVLERRAVGGAERAARSERGVLLGSGLVGGEGLMGVLIAAAVGWQMWRAGTGRIDGEAGRHPPLEIGAGWASSLWEHLPETLALAVAAAFVAYFARRCRHD